MALATDNSRIVRKQLLPLTAKVDVVLPVFALNEINRLNDFGCETAQIICTEQSFTVNLDEKILFRSTLLTEKFPDVFKHLEKYPLTQLTCVTSALIKAIERVSVFHEITTSPMVSVQVQNSVLKVSSPQSETGHSQHLVPARFTTFKADQNVTFNARFLLDALRSFPLTEK